MVSALVVACISWFEFEVHSTYKIVKQSFLLRKQVHKDPTSVNFCKSCDKKDGNSSFLFFSIIVEVFCKEINNHLYSCILIFES